MQLRTLLDELAEEVSHVPHREYSAPAWRQARRAGRRRAMVIAAVAVVLVAVPVALLATRHDEAVQPVDPVGTPFQQRVWEQLRLIGYGETTSYGEIARRMGMTPAASRAVGLANGRNPIAIIVPCHRVLGAGGKLVGYAGGLDRKQLLLELEQEALF